MLKVRVIPTLLWKDLGLVKGKGFDSWRRVGTVLPSIKVYNTRDVDELILVDITATEDKRDLDHEEIEDLTKESFVPLTIGGGVHSLDQIQELLRRGADKVSINSASFTHPEIIKESVEKFGSQCIVASVDAKLEGDKYFCYKESGNIKTDKTVVEHAKWLEEQGVGEILITSIPNDGEMQGYDLELIEAIAKNVKIPIIASGGAGNYEHMYQAIQSGASAVAAASIFHFTEQTPLEAKEYLAKKGIPIRERFKS